jgi:hypothetical protein
MKYPTFEHRHFKAIAAILASLRQRGGEEVTYFDLEDVFADELAHTNPRFDRSRFLAAASGNPCNSRDKI